MDLCQPFNEYSNAQLDEGDVCTPQSTSMWIVEEDSAAVPCRDELWRTMDHIPPVYISGTSIPRAADAKNVDVMQRFMLETGQAPSPWPGYSPRHDLGGDLSGPLINSLHEVGTVPDVATLASPTASGTDNNSQHEMCSSYEGTWSDRASDVALPYGGVLRQPERHNPWGRNLSDVGQESIYGRRTSSLSSAAIVSGAGDTRRNYVTPQEVQVPGTGDGRPDEEQESPYPVSLPPAADSGHGHGHGPVGAMAAGDGDDGDEEQPLDPSSPEAVGRPGRRLRKGGPKNMTPSPAPRGRRDHARATKSGRVTKSKSPRRCGEHPNERFKNAAEWRRHLQSSHQQPFKCIFADDYKCPATFGSKNEWKRHINCLHLRLSFWRCHFDGCNVGGQQQHPRPDARFKDFNRKDLFTQHLRRMHFPEESKNDATKSAAWNKDLPAKQLACYIDNRPPPDWGHCGFCDEHFEGEGSWDDCLEHIGKHFERLECVGRTLKVDDRLQSWMVHHHLLEPNGRGELQLTVEGKQRRARPKPQDESDPDADADDDDEGQIEYVSAPVPSIV